MNLQPWQKELLNKVHSGIKSGEMMVQFTGRQAGKSFWSGQAVDRLMRDLNSQPVSDLVLSDGTVYGARYHCVEPIGGSWIEMQEWCLNQFDRSGKHIWGAKETPEPQQRWYMNNRKFWFRDDADRMMFVLKWR